MNLQSQLPQNLRYLQSLEDIEKFNFPPVTFELPVQNIGDGGEIKTPSSDIINRDKLQAHKIIFNINDPSPSKTNISPKLFQQENIEIKQDPSYYAQHVKHWEILGKTLGIDTTGNTLSLPDMVPTSAGKISNITPVRQYLDELVTATSTQQPSETKEQHQQKCNAVVLALKAYRTMLTKLPQEEELNCCVSWCAGYFTYFKAKQTIEAMLLTPVNDAIQKIQDRAKEINAFLLENRNVKPKGLAQLNWERALSIWQTKPSISRAKTDLAKLLSDNYLFHQDGGELDLSKALFLISKDNIPWDLIAQIKGVTHLNLDDNGIKELPEVFCKTMSSVTSLSLKNNEFTSLGFISNFPKLKQLDIRRNKTEFGLSGDEFMKLTAHIKILH